MRSRGAFGFGIRDFGLLISLAAALLFFAEAGRAGFVYESPNELFSTGDFDGDGNLDLVIVDRATGDYRLGYQLTPGNYTWVSPRASGVTNVSGVSIGKLLSLTRDALAFTAPDANRVNLFDASSPSSNGVPVSVFPGGLGPNLAVAIDIGGVGTNAYDDLFIGSIWNGAINPNQFTLERNAYGTNFSDISSTPVTAPLARGNAVTIKTATTLRAAVLLRGGSNDAFNAYDLSTNVPVLTLSAAGLPTGSDYVCANFSTDSRAQFLFYRPGQSNLLLYPVREPVPGTFQFGPSNTFNLANPIGQVITLPGSSSTRLLVIFGGGESASVYNFDGTNAPALLQSLTPDAGQLFSGAAAFTGTNFMTFSAQTGSGRSTHFRPYTFNGINYVAGTGGSLPALNRFTAAANVLLFEFEPFVSPEPVLVQTLNAGDWTSGLLLSGGTPKTITATNESFLGTGPGLGNAGSSSLGPAASLANFGLVNQYGAVISVFSYSPAIGNQAADVTIAPPSGLYNTSIKISFVTNGPPSQVFYRFGASGNWLSYPAGSPIQVFSNTTVSYYAQVNASPGKSSIRSATYQFTATPDKLDSNGDGIPDYVKIARGLDPLSKGNDADGDGFTDFDELIHGTNPLNTNSAPAHRGSDQEGAFDWVATPLPLDGFSNVISLCATGTAVRAYDLSGSLLAYGITTNVTIPGVINPAGVLSNIFLDPRQRLLAVGTEANFYMVTTNTDKKIGRELVGLLPMPAFSNALVVPYTFGGGNLSNEANAWIAAASNALANAARPMLKQPFTIYDSLTALLVEDAIGKILLDRGNTDGTNLTLFPFRPSDTGRASLDLDTLLSLEFRTTNGKPAYLLQPMFLTVSNQVNSLSDPDVAALRSLTAAIYRISSASNNAAPGVYPLPIDALRLFIDTGVVQSNYFSGRLLTAGEFSDDQQYHAQRAVSNILASIAARPTTNILLVVRPDTFAGGCTVLDTTDVIPAPVSLFHPGGTPYQLLASFDLPPGSQVQVFGYTDVMNTNCPGLGIEVISLDLLGVPAAPSPDANGNLLPDAWESLFGIHDPFGDTDSDGYSNLEEMLAGTDPTDPLSHPLAAPEILAPPRVSISMLPDGQLLLQWSWPAVYADKITFSVLSSPTVTGPYLDTLVVPGRVGDSYQVTLPNPGTSRQFYRLALQSHG